MFRNFWVNVYLLFLLFGVYYLYSIYRQNEDDEELWNQRKEKSCHLDKTIDDALPLLLRNTSIPRKSIFFHKTTCKSGLTYRQACVVESAALAHPNHQINVLFTSPVLKYNFDNSVMKTLSNKYSNVRFLRVHIYDFVMETPMEHPVTLLNDDQLDTHIAKVMKYLTMYKYSGIYLGLDVIVGKSLVELGSNWVVRDTPETLSPDMFSFSQNRAGRKFAEVVVG